MECGAFLAAAAALLLNLLLVAVPLLALTQLHDEERLPAYYVEAVTSREYLSDFAVYYVAAAMLRSGDAQIYDPASSQRTGTALGVYPARLWMPYLYPPPLAQALSPVTGFGFFTAAGIWLLASAALLLFACARTIALAPPGRRAWTALLCLTLPYPYVSLYLGQADAPVAACLILAGIALRGGHGRQARALIAVPAVLKLAPGLASLVLLRYRRPIAWPPAAAAVVIAAIVLLAGSQGGAALWTDYVAAVPALSEVTRDWVENLSLSATLRRLFLDTRYSAAAFPLDIPAARLGPMLDGVALVVAAALLALTAGRNYLTTGAPSLSSNPGFSYAAVILIILLAAPITWPTGLSLLIVPAAFFVQHASGSDSRALTRTVIGGILLSVLWAPSSLVPYSALMHWSSLRTLALLGFWLLLLTVPVRPRHDFP